MMRRRFQMLVLSTLALLATASAAGAEPMSLIVGGKARTFQIERPAGAGPHPSIIMLHGANGSVGPAAELTQLGPREGFALVLPQGIGNRWNFFPPGKESSRDAQFFEQHGGVPDDVSFISILVSDLVRRGVADPTRVYLAGLSLGGVMALRMACADAGPFAAIGLLISAMPDVSGADCRPAHPLPALMINGTADRILPYAGGASVRGDSLWPTERLVTFVRRLNGCSEATEKFVDRTDQNKIEVVRSTQCSDGSVIFYRVIGGEHDVPASLNVSRLLLDFFRNKTRRTATPARDVAAKCTRIETRLFADLCNGCTKPPFNQEIRRTSEDEWTVDYVDGTQTRRTYKYHLISESNAEIFMHDRSRNIYARLDLKARKGFARRGQVGNWIPLLDILKADC
jgi:polyhydroxybutyrate depolymerase